MFFYGAYGLSIASEFELPELVQKPNYTTNFDLSIVRSAFELPKTRPTRIYRKGFRASWGGNASVCFLSWPQVADFMIEKGRKIAVHCHTTDQKTLNLFILSEALGFALWQRGLFLLHASSVEINGAAVVFMGAPGAGKSTTTAAFVKTGHRVLGDDMTAIGFDAFGQPFVVPGFPQVKIWASAVEGLLFDKSTLTEQYEGASKYAYKPTEHYDFEPVPLRHYFVLNRARNRKPLERFNPIEAPFEFVKHFPLPSALLQNEDLVQHFKQSMAVAEHAKGWRVRRPADFDALQHTFVPQIVKNI